MPTKLTKQDVINKICNHLMAQQAKSMNAKGPGCAYRGAGNTTCAIGCLIPVDLYNEAIEGTSVYGTDVVEIIEQLVEMPTRQESYNSIELQEKRAAVLDFLSQLQRVHDTQPITAWASELYDIANEHHLLVPTSLKANLPRSLRSPL
jgi:hypothetical protein